MHLEPDRDSNLSSEWSLGNVRAHWHLFVATIILVTHQNRGVLEEEMMVNTTKRRIGSREEAAFLDLVRTCDLLSRGLVQILKTEDISPTQYNVLRILRGSPAGLPCGEIANRMITRDPDVTRLLDRMEKRGLISRSRDIKDRRTVTARITTAGLKVLGRLDEPIQDVHRKQLGHLGRNRLWALTELLATSRANVE